MSPHAASEEADVYRTEATSSLAEGIRVLKQGDTFAIFDRHGDIGLADPEYQGLYHDGTRYLSYLQLRLANERPLLLSSTVKKDNVVLAVDLSNPPAYRGGELTVPQGSIHFFRSKFLLRGVCYERIRITNFNPGSIRVGLSLRYASDFADIFEVRGTARRQRGKLLEPIIEDSAITLGYEGLDKVVRQTRLQFTPAPVDISAEEARFELVLPPHAGISLFVATLFIRDGDAPKSLSYDDAFSRLVGDADTHRSRACSVETSNHQFNEWLERSSADLRMLLTETPHGHYPYAGVPWYSTVFGRDGLLTALAYLWIDPGIAKGTLEYLAAWQATGVDPARDAEPGKILHETRNGEMAVLDEIPFRCYYGSVDSTPLFVMLAAEYYARTGDLALIKRIWPNIEHAIRWIDQYGDADGDGFVEYERHSATGLSNQGWKDSHDSVFHEDGALAHGAIALCEVQGYVYAAKQGAARMAEALGKIAQAARLRVESEQLRVKFDEHFWDEALGCYVHGLDGEKRPLRVRTSNAGHVLFTGIASPARARRLAQTLMSDAFFSGWGIRTVASTEARYNPMSYHNGSVWPHDNAIVAAGLARYGHKKAATAVLTGLFQASRYMDLTRLPELFCGFVQRPDEAPTLYPVACAPQAWAATAVFLLLQACLGLTLRAGGGNKPVVRFAQPTLPDYLNEVHLQGLKVGEAAIDISLRRFREDVGLHIVARRGDVDVLIEK